MIRRVLWTAGSPIRSTLAAGIRLYQVTLSGWLGGQCRFYPTCSDYTLDAIRTRGAFQGSALAIWRILRCNPFGAGGIDRVPERRAPVVYEPVIHSKTADHSSRSRARA